MAKLFNKLTTIPTNKVINRINSIPESYNIIILDVSCKEIMRFKMNFLDSAFEDVQDMDTIISFNGKFYAFVVPPDSKTEDIHLIEVSIINGDDIFNRRKV